MITRMKINDVRIIRKHYVPENDCYVFYGKRSDDRTIGKYIAGWFARGSGIIMHRKTFLDAGSAREYYRQECCEKMPPDHDHTERDFNQQAVYNWEAKYVDPLTSEIDEAGARALVTKIAQDYGIPVPAFKWIEVDHELDDGEPGSFYHAEEHAMYFGHRDRMTLLHETAHAIESCFAQDTPHHGPAFVWVVIELYNRYGGLSLPYLVTTAHQKGVLGDIGAVQDLRWENLQKRQAFDHL